MKKIIIIGLVCFMGLTACGRMSKVTPPTDSVYPHDYAVVFE